MAFNINNFVIDRVGSGTMTSPSRNDEIIWRLTQITNPTLSCTSETQDAMDALGSPIMQFERAKSAEFSAESSILDFNLAAAQFGTEKNIASDTNIINAPKYETFTVSAGQTTVELAEIPTGEDGAEISWIYALQNDESLDVKYALGATATATTFTLTIDDTPGSESATIGLPTGLADGTRIFVKYNRDTERAVEIENRATEFPTAGEFTLEVLGCDPCEKDIKYIAYIIFMNAKLSSDVDITFATDGTHPFSISALQDFCDPLKRLFRIVVPDVIPAA
jgi:hypothetical protein